jgi:quercetin dioxygenase-like cupin family protein
MQILEQSAPAATPLPGIAHATWAAGGDGLKTLSLWRQAMEPGACTPPHSHACEEVVLCEAGEGEVHVAGVVRRFGAGQTLVLPAGELHQIFSIGSAPLVMTAVFSATPVPVALPDGQSLELPWRS